MALATSVELASTPVNIRDEKPSHPLRPILVGVFTLKLAVAALLLTCVSMAPPVAAEGGYSVAD